MYLGQCVIFVLMVLIATDVLQFAISALRLKKWRVIAALALMLAGSFAGDYRASQNIWLNWGGGIAATVVAFLVFVRTNGLSAKLWALVTVVVTGIGVNLFSRIIPYEAAYALSPVVGLVCGLLAFILGRTRNSAIMGALLGNQAAGLLQSLEEYVRGGYGVIQMGAEREINAMSAALAVAAALCAAAVIIGEARLKKAMGAGKLPRQS